jgi:alkylation response protein AidB-like acyl-CoA dehydrogenase
MRFALKRMRLRQRSVVPAHGPRHDQRQQPAFDHESPPADPGPVGIGHDMVTAVSATARPAPATEAADLIARARGLAGRVAARAEAHDRDGSFPFENFEELFKSGLLSLTIPAALGGSGAGAQTVARVLQIIGQARAEEPVSKTRGKGAGPL